MNNSSPDMPLRSGHEFVTQNVAELHEERLTFGQRLSDWLASVAGS